MCVCMRKRVLTRAMRVFMCVCACSPVPCARALCVRCARALRACVCSNVAEFNRGDLCVIRYRAVQQLLAEGAVELV